MTTNDMTELENALKLWDLLRPEVRAFAVLMEEQLRANDHKPGWKHDTPGSLWCRLQDEAYELRDKLQARGTADGIAKEAADVANFAMMIVDVCSTRLAAAEGE